MAVASIPCSLAPATHNISAAASAASHDKQAPRKLDWTSCLAPKSEKNTAFLKSEKTQHSSSTKRAHRQTAGTAPGSGWVSGWGSGWGWGWGSGLSSVAGPSPLYNVHMRASVGTEGRSLPHKATLVPPAMAECTVEPPERQLAVSQSVAQARPVVREAVVTKSRLISAPRDANCPPRAGACMHVQIATHAHTITARPAGAITCTYTCIYMVYM